MSTSSNELYFSPSPPPKPTKLSPKETRLAALEALKRRRLGSMSPRKVANISRSDDVESDPTTGSDDDESEVQSAQDDTNLSKQDRYDEEFVLRHHWKVTMQYLTHLAVDRKLKHISEADKEYFEKSVHAVRRQTSDLAESLLPSTIKAPFKAMLIERPDISFEETEPQSSLKCAGCWHRGRYGCAAGPIYKLTSKRGTYDPKTLRAKSEEYDSDDYVVKNYSADDNAVAQLIPYSPKKRIRIGSRCAERGQLFHTAIHYRYTVLQSIRVLYKEHRQPTGDPEAAFAYFLEEELLEPFWLELRKVKQRIERLIRR
ncbi:hypothetical protein B0H11DRAFT_2216639 [Mycena galericulata]|nr:hypothetical protein B0H11DRAFT_2216639 [Mycena galericulata]